MSTSLGSTTVVAFAVSAIFQCSPINYFWNQFVDSSAEGRCVNINVFGWVNAHWKTKAGVMIMFLMGTFVTIVSILRLQSLIYFANSQGPTWGQFGVANWSTVEVNVGMICTCLPSLRPPLVRLFPKLGGGSRSGRSYEAHSNGKLQGHSNNLDRRTSPSKDVYNLTELESNKGHACERVDTKSMS